MIDVNIPISAIDYNGIPLTLHASDISGVPASGIDVDKTVAGVTYNGVAIPFVQTGQEHTVTFVVPERSNVVFAPAPPPMQTINGVITMPETSIESGAWSYWLRGWESDDHKPYMPGEQVQLTHDTVFTARWFLGSLTGDFTWNFRDSISLMDHVDPGNPFEFNSDQLEIADYNFDGTLNFKDAMAIMSTTEDTPILPAVVYGSEPLEENIWYTSATGDLVKNPAAWYECIQATSEIPTAPLRDLIGTHLMPLVL